MTYKVELKDKIPLYLSGDEYECKISNSWCQMTAKEKFKYKSSYIIPITQIVCITLE